MPGWHDDTKDWQAAGTLQMLGIIQEQHPDRCRLFMQWKQMEWPILVDSLNLTAIDVVPLTYAIDEHGIVRYVKPTREDIEQFLATEYPAPPADPVRAVEIPDLDALRAATSAGSVDAWLRYGDAAFTWGGDGRATAAVEAYEAAAGLDRRRDGRIHFRLWTAYRRRYETAQRRPGDFTRAVEHWAQALEIDPNQYIWRRRLQQYGPRLDKPYPFYDWVEDARRDIVARGERPPPLRVEPGGAEIAQPADSFDASVSTRAEPDPAGRILRDAGEFVTIESTVVPPVIRPGDVARVHLIMRPNAAIKAHWNNEVEPLRVWVAPPEGWAISTEDLTAPQPPEPVSTETREVQFELRGAEPSPGMAPVSAYALYYVCEDVDGTCLYRRQDIELSLRVEE